jgi:hypothetical protein
MRRYDRRDGHRAYNITLALLSRQTAALSWPPRNDGRSPLGLSIVTGRPSDGGHARVVRDARRIRRAARSPARRGTLHHHHRYDCKPESPGATPGALGCGTYPHHRCQFSNQHPARDAAGSTARADRREGRCRQGQAWRVPPQGGRRGRPARNVGAAAETSRARREADGWSEHGQLGCARAVANRRGACPSSL